MKRIGPWVLAGGLTLLCAGIVSTRSEHWKPPGRAEQFIALDMQGVNVLEVTDLQPGKLVIGAQHSQVRIKPWERAARDRASNRALVTRDNDRMQLDFSARGIPRGETTVEIAHGPGLIAGGRLQIETRTNAGTLEVETAELTWTGDADTLRVRALASLDGGARLSCDRLPRVAFLGGRIGHIRISIERGSVRLQNLSQVGRIELHAGPDVALSVGRLEDLRRIEMHPFDGKVTPPPGTSEACRNVGVEAYL